MKVEIKLDIFEGISKIIIELIKIIHDWRIFEQLRELREERFKHKVLSEYADNPLIDSYIDELDKEEVDLRSQLRR
jgi:hypothetical protein